ncbi:MAG: DUF3622 domain-containing protein [Neptuniibacter sp.]
MSQGKKYSSRVTENAGVWNAEILRQASNKKVVVSKRQDNFASEDEAKSWADKELEQFLQQQVERNKRKAEKRVQREEKQNLEEGE